MDLCYEIDGIMMPKKSPRRFLEDIKHNFEVRPDDIFIIDYPKSGTTWIVQVVSLILAKGDIKAASKEHVSKRAPFLEWSMMVGNPENTDKLKGGYEIAAEMTSPRMMKTHLVPRFCPVQLFDKKPKIIYLARNPKDAAVSHFHFCNLTPNLPSYPTWDNFFEEFYHGKAPRGCWFENVLFWWSKRHEENVLFITYEEMKLDIRSCVLRVCKFLEIDLPDDVIDDIITHSSFAAMKKNPSSNPDYLPALKGIVNGKKSFLRKGQVGDWKSHFTVAQNERFDELYRQKTLGTGLHFIFEM